jgi:DNA-binding transcriptional ArsR family regulator
MSDEPDIAKIANLIGDKARSKILIALMGGKALTATELSLEADVTAQTTSSHLSKLLENDLVRVRKQGRHRYYQLAGFEIAELLEKILNVSYKIEHSRIQTGPENPDLRRFRICYDHLAGEVAVSLLDVLMKNHYMEDINQELVLSEKGRDFFNALGADLDLLKQKRRPLCKYCLDWSERKYHLAGSLGQWILKDLFEKEWAEKDLDSRVIRFTNSGLQHFRKRYGLT